MKVYLRTFGCRANHYDTEAVRSLVLAGGHEVVADVADSDIAIFNSCAVTASAEAELRKVVRQAGKRRPELRSVVMGCAPALDHQRAPALRVRSLPTVDHVVAGADLAAIAEALGIDPRLAAVRAARQPLARALLRVQDGCDEHCTFCATTLARGPNRSRAIEDLVREAAALAEWHSEIVITGIHIGTYGRDIETSLGALVARLVRDVPAVRFRLSSIEATEIDDVLAELFVSVPERLVPHVHAPLQSGSDRVLRRMGRHWYTRGSYAHAIERLASRMSILGLGADVITGFPGETSADHAETLAMIERLPFTYLHVFPYSPRPGTSAPRLGGQVPPAASTERAAELREAAARKARAHAATRAGGIADVVVIGGAAEREGLTGDYLTVSLADASLPRGTRFTAMLSGGNGQLIASALQP